MLRDPWVLLLIFVYSDISSYDFIKAATVKNETTTVTATSGNISPAPVSGGIVTQEMAFYCFDLLIAKLNTLPAPKAPAFTNAKYPLFVTWKKGPHLELRGCIGTFSPLPLHEGLQEYAIKSALHDSRFSPIQLNELKDLQVSVALLTNFEDGENYLDWTIGVHGIRIEFNDRGTEISATFLPYVAPEQGWTQVQTIDALLRKGGFRGPITNSVRESIKLRRYQNEKISVTYGDYMKARGDQNPAVFSGNVKKKREE